MRASGRGAGLGPPASRTRRARGRCRSRRNRTKAGTRRVETSRRTRSSSSTRRSSAPVAWPTSGGGTDEGGRVRSVAVVLALSAIHVPQAGLVGGADEARAHRRSCSCPSWETIRVPRGLPSVNVWAVSRRATPGPGRTAPRPSPPRWSRPRTEACRPRARRWHRRRYQRPSTGRCPRWERCRGPHRQRR